MRNTGVNIINAIDEGDRWRLIAMGSERSKNFDKLDMRILFDSIQKLPSAEFKNMYAESLENVFSKIRELNEGMSKPMPLKVFAKTISVDD